MTPRDAVQRYLNERRADISDSTYYNHSSMLKQFTEWCDAENVKHINDIDQWDISDFKVYRRDEDGINNVTLYNQMTTLRVFIEWCESKGLLSDLAENMLMPDRGNAARDEKLEPDEGRAILQYLNKYDYASQRHALFATLWDTGFRLGTVVALDVDDFHHEEAYLEVHHRPETDTPLKNKDRAEREVNIHSWGADILNDYINERRPDVTDDYGREPLLATSQGRAARTTLRKRIRCLTRPCEYGEGCPYDRDPKTCEATSYKYAARCPGSVKPHSLRRSAITNFLNDGHSKELVSDRMDVSKKILDKHYDGRTESEKRELRREMFEMD